jgi:hypothetical protein
VISTQSFFFLVLPLQEAMGGACELSEQISLEAVEHDDEEEALGEGAGEEEVFCLCAKPNDGKPYVGCEICNQW